MKRVNYCKILFICDCKDDLSKQKKCEHHKPTSSKKECACQKKDDKIYYCINIDANDDTILDGVPCVEGCFPCHKDFCMEDL